MSFYTRFDWTKKLRLFVNVRNRKIDVVLKPSRAVVMISSQIGLKMSHIGPKKIKIKKE